MSECTPPRESVLYVHTYIRRVLCGCARRGWSCAFDREEDAGGVSPGGGRSQPAENPGSPFLPGPQRRADFRPSTRRGNGE